MRVPRIALSELVGRPSPELSVLTNAPARAERPFPRTRRHGLHLGGRADHRLTPDLCLQLLPWNEEPA